VSFNVEPTSTLVAPNRSVEVERPVAEPTKGRCVGSVVGRDTLVAVVESGTIVGVDILVVAAEPIVVGEELQDRLGAVQRPGRAP
jgi:hypothetical protein